jgi:hypothetical protein
MPAPVPMAIDDCDCSRCHAILDADRRPNFRAVNSREGGKFQMNDTTSSLDPPPQNASMTNERLAKLEGTVDSLKVVRPMTITVIGVFLAAQVFVIGLLASQMRDINAKVDAIPARLSDEFRAMRAEMAAQTAAIAGSITATRQAQPQILIVPAPSPAPQPPAR